MASFTRFALFRATIAVKWRDRKQLCQLLAVSIPLAIAVACILWFGHPWSRNSSGNFGFGPDWQCTTHALSEPTCIRNVQKPSATQPNAGSESR
jgi:hypothetical protein